MPDISPTYASPGLRWALFRHDHPKAPDPVFRLATAEELGIPREWAGGTSQDFTGEFVVCTIDPADGGEPVRAWKEIPKREKRRTGGWVDFTKTPDNWNKLTTMALGRALKKAGYPDDTDDLKGIILWRRRDVELRALEEGRALPALGPAPLPAPSEADLDAAARTSPTAEHPEQGDDEPAEGELLAEGDEGPWSEEATSALQPLTERFDADQKATLAEFAASRGYGPYWTLTGGPLKTVTARARSIPPASGSRPSSTVDQRVEEMRVAEAAVLHREASTPPASVLPSPQVPRNGPQRLKPSVEPFPAPADEVQATMEHFETLSPEEQEAVFTIIGSELSDRRWDDGMLLPDELDAILAAIAGVESFAPAGVGSDGTLL